MIFMVKSLGHLLLCHLRNKNSFSFIFCHYYIFYIELHMLMLG